MNWFGLLMMCVLVKEEGEEAPSEGGRQSLLWCPGSPPDGERRRRPQIRGSTTRGANEKAPNQMADRGVLTDNMALRQKQKGCNIKHKADLTETAHVALTRRTRPVSSCNFCADVSLAKTDSTSHKERGRMPIHPAQWSISPRG